MAYLHVQPANGWTYTERIPVRIPVQKLANICMVCWDSMALPFARHGKFMCSPCNDGYNVKEMMKNIINLSNNGGNYTLKKTPQDRILICNMCNKSMAVSTATTWNHRNYVCKDCR